MRAAMVWKSVGCATLCGGTVFGCLAGPGEGLHPSQDRMPWERWQARMMLGVATPVLRHDVFDRDGARLSSLSLLGDYYIGQRMGLGLGLNGGLRATSGLLFGPHTGLLNTVSAGQALSVERRNLLGAPASGDLGSTPYVGLGYTGVSAKGGWGLSADVGLVASRMFNASQALDDQVREMRLTPLVQLGVSYAF